VYQMQTLLFVFSCSRCDRGVDDMVEKAEVGGGRDGKEDYRTYATRV
jgi:hypothetical protein